MEKCVIAGRNFIISFRRNISVVVETPEAMQSRQWDWPVTISVTQVPGEGDNGNRKKDQRGASNWTAMLPNFLMWRAAAAEPSRPSLAEPAASLRTAHAARHFRQRERSLKLWQCTACTFRLLRTQSRRNTCFSKNVALCYIPMRD